MRKMMFIILTLLMLFSIALASEPANPANPAMIAELLPGHTLVEGIDDGDALRLLMKRGDGALVFVGGVRGEDGMWRFTESTPLPEGTHLGVENFTHSLGFPTETPADCISVRPYADGSWGVSLIAPRDGGMFFLGKRVIYDDGHPIDGVFGDHPWADVSTIDWASLPSSYADALARMEQDNWAVVNNPNPEDRLHLRVSPDKDAASLGKYYSRTPVRIRDYGEDWCAVTVCGVDGYMMTRYLAFGADMDTVEYAGPWLSLKAELTEFRLYAKPRSTSDYTVHPIPGHWPDFYVIGIAGDYYHIWLPYTEEYGYVHMDDLWEGNG